MIWWLGWRAAQVTVHTSSSLHSNSCWTDPVSSICCSWPFQTAPVICAVQSRYPAIISKDPCEVQGGLAHLVLALNVVSSIILVMSSDGVLIDKSSGGNLGSLPLFSSFSDFKMLAIPWHSKFRALPVATYLYLHIY